MSKYYVEITENDELKDLIEELFERVEKEWTIITCKTESFSSEVVFDTAKDMSYFVIKDNKLFYCGPVNVRKFNLLGESKWIFDYVYFSKGRRKIQRDLSDVWLLRVFEEGEGTDEIIDVPTVLSYINGELEYIKRCEVYKANQIGDTYIVNWKCKKADVHKYDISIYKNSILEKEIIDISYVKMSSVAGQITYSEIEYSTLVAWGGRFITYDFISKTETIEVKKGRIREKQEWYDDHNYIKVEKLIYKYIPEGFVCNKINRQKFDDELLKLKEFLPEFGIIKEIEEKDYYIEGEYCFITDINNCFAWLMEKMSCENTNRRNGNYKFQIVEKFNKLYYCVAALSVYAERIEKKGELVELIFSGESIENIELMYYFATTGGRWDSRNEEERKIIDYLIENSKIWLCVFVIEALVDQLSKQASIYGIRLSRCYSSILYEIIKSEKKKIKIKVDILYKKMIDEGRVSIKWGNEFKLYTIIKKYVRNVEYQYRCEWLGLQSFDIFLPEYNLAIEYQGQQHYEPVEFFGGEESFEKNVERDNKKRMLAEENGVDILEWEYWKEISEESVKTFLVEHDVQIEKSEESLVVSSNEMLPVIQDAKKKKVIIKTQREVTEWYVQYSMEGKFVEKYVSAKRASEVIGVSCTSILKCIRGERNTAGGFVWKKVPAEEIIQDRIIIDFDTTKTNSGKAVKVLKIDGQGKVIKEYCSLQEAAAANQMQVKTIKRKAEKQMDGWMLITVESHR